MFVLQEGTKHASNLQPETVFIILIYTLLISIFIAFGIYIVTIIKDKKTQIPPTFDPYNICYIGPSKDCEIIRRHIHTLIDDKGYATIHDFYKLFRDRYYTNSFEHDYGWTSKDIWAFEIHKHRTKKWILKCPKPRRIKR